MDQSKESNDSAERRLTVRQRDGRWGIAFETTPLLQFGQHIQDANEALAESQALYPRFVVKLE